MYVVCGLGNPGVKYSGTRHNVGFNFLNEMFNRYESKIIKKNKSKEIYLTNIKKEKYYLIKTLTYMNLSGPPIGRILNYYKIPKKNLLVVHDDLDLVIGKIKIKQGGGNGGHRGLQSIDTIIGNSYKRLRIGIGHPGSKYLVDQYVLQKFNSGEEKIISKLIKFSVKNIDLLFTNRELFLTRISVLFNKQA